jgi:hypothetical protein
MAEEYPTIAAHRKSSNHRDEILASALCGCFYCCETFSPLEIEEWVDEDTTALCPRCGIDSVIGAASGYPIDKGFLGAMRRHWFGNA